MKPLQHDAVEFVKLYGDDEFPPWTSRNEVALFLHETMLPHADTVEDIHRGMDYAFSKETGKGGFVMLAGYEGKLAGALVMLFTGMGGYIPENLLLFVSVDAKLRGLGLGRRLCERAIGECTGSVKLHVIRDNPAKRLYERMGFVDTYADMRLIR